MRGGWMTGELRLGGKLRAIYGLVDKPEGTHAVGIVIIDIDRIDTNYKNQRLGEGTKYRRIDMRYWAGRHRRNKIYKKHRKNKNNAGTQQHIHPYKQLFVLRRCTLYLRGENAVQ